jgi:hypothetical protein
MQPGDVATTDWHRGKVTRVEVLERREVARGCQTGVLYRIRVLDGKPILGWLDAGWFSVAERASAERGTSL